MSAATNQLIDAEGELKSALAASKPGDEYFTSVAEIRAMGGDAKGVMEALATALQRKEPTASYVLLNPLFAFLQSEPEFQKMRDQFQAQQQEIRTLLEQIPL